MKTLKEEIKEYLIATGIILIFAGIICGIIKLLNVFPIPTLVVMVTAVLVSMIVEIKRALFD